MVVCVCHPGCFRGSGEKIEILSQKKENNNKNVGQEREFEFGGKKKSPDYTNGPLLRGICHLIVHENGYSFVLKVEFFQGRPIHFKYSKSANIFKEIEQKHII